MVKVLYGKMCKMKNRRIGLAYLSDGTWYIKGKSLCRNLGTNQVHISRTDLRLTSEAMRCLMTMFTEIVLENDLTYKK
jgi:hypothetical protein